MRTPDPAWRALTPQEFAPLFSDLFTRSAFRLEQLDHYATPVEERSFDQYLRGEPPDLAWREPWLKLIADAVAAGKSMTRVRAVSEPWTDYTGFELTVAYPSGVAAGEDIRITTSRDKLPSHDFWLTDEPGTVARMHYTESGVWTGVDLTDRPAIVQRYRSWRDTAISASVPLDMYLEAIRRRTA